MPSADAALTGRPHRAKRADNDHSPTAMLEDFARAVDHETKPMATSAYSIPSRAPFICGLKNSVIMLGHPGVAP